MCFTLHKSKNVDLLPDAPEAALFDTYQEIMSWLPSIKHSVLQAGSMLLSGGATGEEAQLLQQWIACQP